MSIENLSSIVREFLELESEIKQRQIILESLKDEIKKEMESRQLEELEVDEHVVRYKDVLISIFNKSEFKKKYEELYTGKSSSKSDVRLIFWYQCKETL